MICEELVDGGSLVWVFLQTILDKVAETRVPGACGTELGRVFVQDLKNNFHCSHVRIWRVTLSEFDGSDSQRPYICLVIVTCLLHYLRGHPAGRTHKSVSRLTFLKRGRDTEVTDKYVSIHVHQNIACLDVTVNLLVVMEVM